MHNFVHTTHGGRKKLKTRETKLYFVYIHKEKINENVMKLK